MKMEELNDQVARLLDIDTADTVRLVTGAFEVAIIRQLLEPDGQVELENLGTFANQDGLIVFKPSTFLTSAVQVVRGMSSR